MKSDDFKVCYGYSSYEVSLNGSVREVRSKKTVKTYTFDDGTIYVVLKKGKHYRKIKVAELIALTYLEHKEYDVLVCLNGNWNDYSISNYKWVNPDYKLKTSPKFGSRLKEPKEIMKCPKMVKSENSILVAFL